MITYRRNEWIHLPPQRLFDFLTDQANLPEWSPEVVRSEPVSGGELRAGSTLRQTRRVAKREMTSDVVVVTHRPPSEHAVKTRILGVEATFTFAFRPEGSGTRVEFDAAVAGRGPGKLLERPMARAMEKSDDRLLVRLREAVDRQNAAPPPEPAPAGDS